MNLCNTNNYDNAIIAEKIKKECMRQNITIKTMLQELSIGKDTVQQMYKYDKTPNYKSIARICDYLNISVDTLLERPIPEPEPVSLSAAINTVAAAAHISPDALRAVLHLPINDI
jgi:transcriptional regulator with XRE-family HTH domain